MQPEEVKTATETVPVIEDKTITSPEPETQDQINWKKFREQREVERKQTEEANKRASEKEAEAQALKAAMEAILNKPQPQNNYSDSNEESEDERIQKKVNAALLERDKIYEEERRKREQVEFPQKLAQVYSDFNQICTTENLDYLEYHHPEVAKAFRYAPDGFDKWSDIYKAVKRYVPNPDSKKDQNRADKNMSKPQSMATPAVTQTGDTAPIQLDEKRRADNWQRMQRIMKGG